MTKLLAAVTQLSDDDLLAEVKAPAVHERKAPVRLIALLAQMLRHSIPNGDPAAIFDRALTLLLADLERAKFAATSRPRAARPTASGSHHIPAAVRRAVWQRDGGQCAFVGSEARCTERGFLEFHPPTLFELRRGLAVALAKADHVRPDADGGATAVGNLELRCRKCFSACSA